jgi:hypothetical protein
VATQAKILNIFENEAGVLKPMQLMIVLGKIIKFFTAQRGLKLFFKYF